MKRREAIKISTLILGAGVSVPALVSLLQNCSPDKTPLSQNTFFSQEHLDIVSSISDTIIPKTDTPGAVEAGVPAFIEKFVQLVLTEEQRNRFLAGLDEMNFTSKNRFKKKFLDIRDGQKFELIQSMNQAALTNHSRNTPPLEGPFILMIKGITLVGYYTSMPGATQALQYLPVPGIYSGCEDISVIGKAWAIDTID